MAISGQWLTLGPIKFRFKAEKTADGFVVEADHEVPGIIALLVAITLGLTATFTLPAIASPPDDTPAAERPDDRGDENGQGQGQGSQQGGPNGQGRGNGDDTTTTVAGPGTTVPGAGSTTTVPVTPVPTLGPEPTTSTIIGAPPVTVTTTTLPVITTVPWPPKRNEALPPTDVVPITHEPTVPRIYVCVS